MDIVWSSLLALVGLVIVIVSAEQTVKGAVGSAAGFGLSTFLISVIFIGFDPDNLSVGVDAVLNGSGGIATGSIIGAAMVAITFAYGVSALFAPMRFAPIPRGILAIPIGTVLLLGALAWDGVLSRVDGGILVAAYAATVGWLVWLGRQGRHVQAGGESAAALEKTKNLGPWKAVGLLAAGLVGIVIGTELLVSNARDLIQAFGLSETFIGMTAIAFLVSIEELAREVPAAMKGQPEISFGNVLGSAVAMFLFNAGVIALVAPLRITADVRWFYLPSALVATAVVTAFMGVRRLPPWGGALLVLLYVGFVIGSYFVGGSGSLESARAPARVRAAVPPPVIVVDGSTGVSATDAKVEGGR